MHVMVKESLNQEGKEEPSHQPVHGSINRTDFKIGMRQQMQQSHTEHKPRNET
jgi:hypothetical protein